MEQVNSKQNRKTKFLGKPNSFIELVYNTNIKCILYLLKSFQFEGYVNQPLAKSIVLRKSGLTV